MPHCTNCGTAVKNEHFYCGSCGKPLTDETSDDGEAPFHVSSSMRDGFLSGRSIQYLTNVLKGEQEWNDESPGFMRLSKDVRGALSDFGIVGSLDQADLIDLIIAGSESTEDILGKDVEELTKEEVDERLLYIGFVQLPGLYDQTFGTAMKDALTDRMEEIEKKMEEIKESEGHS